MTLLFRHLARVVIGSVLLVAAVLIGMECFVLFVNELGDIGHGHYGGLQALLFVGLSLPDQLYQMFPCVCLIGAMLGLGQLAADSELTVMRASGLSVGRLGWFIMQIALMLALTMTVLGETAIPKATQWAENYKAMKTSNGDAMRAAGGLWLRSDNAFIHIDKVVNNHHLAGIQQYRFDSHYELKQSLKAEDAVFENQHWQLQHVDYTNLTADMTHTVHQPTMDWSVQLQPRLLKVAALEPNEMPLHLLHRFIQAQSRNHIDVGRYHLAFWQRLLHPLTTAIMMLLAVPFIFGSMRSSSTGGRLMLGIVFGFGYYMLNRFLGPVSLVYQWPPVLAAVTPSLVFMLLAMYLLRRVA